MLTVVLPEAMARLLDADPARAMTIACFGRFVADGRAEWAIPGNGDIHLRMISGEVFLLAETEVVRIS
ncbi:MAG: hypothetical protein P0Y59_11475 [Candidatus Sphingomonas phytovorans]|nr:hypothetical protein [Sphingomonas sp.]WEK02267.1 MAG: hypothetical protein P0Y59_11475 [Sphingomonas sp.]